MKKGGSMKKFLLVYIVFFVAAAVKGSITVSEGPFVSPWWEGSAARMQAMGGLTIALPDLSHIPDAYTWGLTSAFAFREKTNLLSATLAMNSNIGSLTGLSDYSLNHYGIGDNMFCVWLTDENAVIIKPEYIKTNELSSPGTDLNGYLGSVELEYVRVLDNKSSAGAMVRYTNARYSAANRFPGYADYLQDERNSRLEWDINYSWLKNDADNPWHLGPDFSILTTLGLGFKRGGEFYGQNTVEYAASFDRGGYNYNKQDFNYASTLWSGSDFQSAFSTTNGFDLSYSSTVKWDKDGSMANISFDILNNIFSSYTYQDRVVDVSSSTKTSYYGFGCNAEFDLRWVVFKNWAISCVKTLGMFSDYDKRAGTGINVTEGLTMGAAWKNEFVAAAWETYFNDYEPVSHVGLEIKPVEALALRAGLTSSADGPIILYTSYMPREPYLFGGFGSIRIRQLSFGAGYNMDKFIIDVAVIRDYSNDRMGYLGNIKYIF